DVTLTRAINKALPPFDHQTPWLNHPQRERWRLAAGGSIEVLQSARYTAARLQVAHEAQHLDALRARATSVEAAIRCAAVQFIARGWSDHPETLGWLRERAVRDAHGGVRRTAVQFIARGWSDHPETLGWLRERAVRDAHW